jgi:hypothetical protein
MNRVSSTGQLFRVAIMVAVLSTSGGCVKCDPLCVLPTAITITVTSSAAAGPVNGVVVQANGSVGPTQCAGSPTTCLVLGSAGTYSLDISAPGFQTAKRTVTVTGSPAAACGCGGADTEHIDVALVATP